MNTIIKNIKEKIGFKLFQVECERRRGNFSSIIPYLESCQFLIDNLGKPISKPTNSSDDKEKIRKIKEKVKKRISELEREKNKLTDQKKDTSNISSRIEELKLAISELDFLETTATQYIFKKNKKAPQMNLKTENVIEIQHGDLGSVLHELHHAFQYETGKIDFIKTDDGEYIPGFLYDSFDERSAYKRQLAFDGILKFTIKVKEEEVFQSLKTKYISNVIIAEGSVLGVKEIRLMKDITIDVIMKIAEPKTGLLYQNISSTELNTKSPLLDVINNNRYKEGYLNEFGFHRRNLHKPYIEFIKVFIDQTPRIYVKE